MGDPLSVASGIGGLIQLADLVVNRIWPYLKEVKNQRSEISKLASEVASLAGVLHSLRLLSEGSVVPIKPTDVLECQTTLEELRNRLKKVAGLSLSKRDQAKTIVRQLCFPYERAELQKILERLERLKSTFHLTLAAESIASQIDLKANVEAIKNELFRRKELEAKIELDEKRKKVLDFFGSVGPKENHAMSLKLRHEGTGLWLLNNEHFKEWLQNCDSHIWCYGIPGAGKTVLASLLIEKVLQVCKPSEVIAYFYCDYKDTAKQDPCQILASIASQIAIQHESAYEVLADEHEKVHHGTNQVKDLKPEILVNVLKKQLRLFDITTLIIDGLDECGDNTENVLDHLISLAQEFKLALRLAILSRDELIIRQRLAEIDCKSICIAATSTDIRLYAASEIERRVRNGRLLVEDPSTKDKILEILIDKAQGMFRWVACQLDYICDLAGDDEYCKALDVPAPTLFEIYERLLLRLQKRPKSTQDLVKAALMWILFSKPSLRITELCEAVAIRAGITGSEKPNPAALNQIRKFCSSLIREAANGEQLEVAHFTVKEFFSSISRESHPQIAHFCLSEEEAYLEFSKVCLTYLNFKDFHRPIPAFDDLEYSLENHLLYRHAAFFWISYARDHWTDENVLQLAKQLFKPPMTTNFKLWRNCIIINIDGGSELMGMFNNLGDSLLHWAAYLGIHDLLEWLVSYGQDINSVGALGTPLSAAMSFSHDLFDLSEMVRIPPYSVSDIWMLTGNLDKKKVQSCIKTLVQLGARTEQIYECYIEDQEYNLSLSEVLLYSFAIQVLEMECCAREFLDEHVAARMKSVINLCEKKYSDLNMRGMAVQMLRKMEASYIVPEFRPVFDDFVEELEDDIEVDYEIMDKIWTAAQNDQADVLESLLKYPEGIKINEKDDILDDIDSNQDDEYGHEGKNAFHYAASAGSFECLQLLMDAGASVQITAENGTTALHFAAGSPNVGAKKCVEMLMDAGLSLDAKSDEDWTMLHFAASSGHPRVVEFLLERGFDPQLADDSGRTAYHLAARNSSSDVLKLLLEHENGGISGVHISDADGLKPAQLAVVEDHSGFICELLRHVNIKELGVKEEPFLFFVARRGSAAMIKAVLDTNPDIFVQGNDQSTIIQAMKGNHHDISKVTNEVMEIWSIYSRNDGSKPLHRLLSSQQPVEKYLVHMMSRGNPYDVNSKGNNYLMCLLDSHRPQSQKRDIAMALIKLGVSSFQKNHEGDFFYYQLAKSDPDSALQIMPLVNDLRGMDKVHRRLSGWWTIHFAIIEGKLSLVKALLAKGACLSEQTAETEFNVEGRYFISNRLNCIHVAALYGRKHILKYILETSNLPVDSRNGDGGTALHLAAFNGSGDCVKFLLSNGADAKMQDDSGNGALHYAIDSRGLPVVKLLLKAGAPIVTNQEGDNPIDLAMKKNRGDIADLLRKYQDSRRLKR